MAVTEDISFNPPIEHRIVVGHDGSASADTAMRWGVEQARLRAEPLHVVRAWTLSGVLRDMGGNTEGIPSFDEAGAWVEAKLRQTLDGCGAEGVTVHTHVIHESTAEVLLAAAAAADLLIIGNRGRGGLAGALMGSVAERVVRHATGTVVVVRGSAAK